MIFLNICPHVDIRGKGPWNWLWTRSVTGPFQGILIPLLLAHLIFRVTMGNYLSVSGDRNWMSNVFPKLTTPARSLLLKSTSIPFQIHLLPFYQWVMPRSLLGHFSPHLFGHIFKEWLEKPSGPPPHTHFEGDKGLLPLSSQVLLSDDYTASDLAPPNLGISAFWLMDVFALPQLYQECKVSCMQHFGTK